MGVSSKVDQSLITIDTTHRMITNCGAPVVGGHEESPRCVVPPLVAKEGEWALEARIVESGEPDTREVLRTGGRARS